MKKYIGRIDILNYLKRCCNTMTVDELGCEIDKIKNMIEEQDISSIRSLLGS